MEEKSKARGKIQIPTGCKATIENNQIIIEEEQKQEEFKDGDILISKYTNSVAIFKNYIREDRLKFLPYYYSNENIDSSRLATHCFRHATEEEKQKFFTALEAKGLHWNAETKTMEKFRERERELLRVVDTYM